MASLRNENKISTVNFALLENADYGSTPFKHQEMQEQPVLRTQLYLTQTAGEGQIVPLWKGYPDSEAVEFLNDYFPISNSSTLPLGDGILGFVFHGPVDSVMNIPNIQEVGDALGMNLLENEFSGRKISAVLRDRGVLTAICLGCSKRSCLCTRKNGHQYDYTFLHNLSLRVPQQLTYYKHARDQIQGVLCARFDIYARVILCFDAPIKIRRLTYDQQLPIQFDKIPTKYHVEVDSDEMTVEVICSQAYDEDMPVRSDITYREVVTRQGVFSVENTNESYYYLGGFDGGIIDDAEIQRAVDSHFADMQQLYEEEQEQNMLKLLSDAKIENKRTNADFDQDEQIQCTTMPFVKMNQRYNCESYLPSYRRTFVESRSTIEELVDSDDDIVLPKAFGLAYAKLHAERSNKINKSWEETSVVLPRMFGLAYDKLHNDRLKGAQYDTWEYTNDPEVFGPAQRPNHSLEAFGPAQQPRNEQINAPGIYEPFQQQQQPPLVLQNVPPPGLPMPHFNGNAIINMPDWQNFEFFHHPNLGEILFPQDMVHVPVLPPIVEVDDGYATGASSSDEEDDQ